MQISQEVAQVFEHALQLNNIETWLAQLPDHVTLKREDLLRLLEHASNACNEWERHAARLERSLHLASEELLERNFRLSEALNSIQRKEQELANALNDVAKKSEELRSALEERDQALKLLEYARNRFSQLFYKMPIASITIDSDGLVWEWNERAAPLFLISEDQALSAPLRAVLGEECISEETLNKLKGVLQGIPFEEQKWVIHQRHLLVNAIPLQGPDEALTGVLLALVDITQLRRKEKELADKIAELKEAREALEQANRRLASLATIDGLTGIPNRRSLDDQLTVVTSETKRGKPFCLALIDLDHFKNINDELGHDIGDEVLQRFAKTLRESVRKSDFVARYGGEEFAVIFPNTPLHQAIPICERIRQRAKEISLGNHTLTVSIGVAYGDVSHDAKTVLKKADDALYQAKRSGRDKVIAGSSKHTEAEVA